MKKINYTMKLKLKKTELVDSASVGKVVPSDMTPAVAGGVYTESGCHATRTCPRTGSTACYTKYCRATDKFKCMTYTQMP